MVNLTLPTLPKRPGVGEGLNADATAAAENLAPAAPSAKSTPKFEDHLAARPSQSPVPPRSQDARGSAKAPPPKATQGERVNLRSPEPNTGAAQAKALKAPVPTKVEARPEATDALKRAPAAKADGKSPPAQKPVDRMSGQKGAAVQAKSAGLDQAATKLQSKDKGDGSVLVIQASDIPASEQGELDTVSLDLDEENGENWEKRLQDMLAFMGVQPGAIQQELPTLAILTGQMQFVEPDTIAATLAQSPMLNNVLSSADPAQIVNEVKPLGAWLDEMGWSPEGLVVQDPVAFQDLMNTPVALKDLMQTFQVDVDRVVTEAKILQETIPMDGAAPYIARAIKMKADPSLPQPAPHSVETAPELNPMDAEFLSVIMNAGAAAQQSTVAAAPKAPDASPAPKLDAVQSASLSALDQMLSSMGASPLGLEGLPKAMLTADNPFQSIEMRSSETYVFKPEAAAGDAPTLMPRGDRQDWLEGIQALALRPESADVQTSDKNTVFDPAALLERLADVTMGGSGDSKNSQSEGDSDDFLNQGDESLPDLNGTAATHKPQGAFTLETEKVAKAEAPQQMQKAVFENASLLVKEGGGAIRIDIGNKEIGAVDLAVEVKDGVVDIKIVAGSPEAREMLATELPKLRESLQTQNLNLSKVEIGLSGGSSWTSSDGRSSGRESSSQKEELFGVSGASRKSSKSYSRASSTQSLQPQVITDGGSIKVRV